MGVGCSPHEQDCNNWYNFRQSWGSLTVVLFVQTGPKEEEAEDRQGGPNLQHEKVSGTLWTRTAAAMVLKSLYFHWEYRTLLKWRCKPCSNAGVNRAGGKRSVWEFRCTSRAGICHPDDHLKNITVLFWILFHRILTTFLNSLFRSIQEIEATRFDQEGKTVPATGQFESRRAEEERDDGDDEENSPHDAKGALESSLSSLGSPSPSLQSLPSPDQVNSSSVGDTNHLLTFQGPSSLSSAGSPGILAPPFSPSLAGSSMAPPFSPASMAPHSPHSPWPQGTIFLYHDCRLLRTPAARLIWNDHAFTLFMVMFHTPQADL